MTDPSDDSMHYISAAEIYTINEEILGHKPLVRDRRLLQAAMQRPFVRMFGQAAYPTLLDKAAALMHSLAHDHIFADGNKRTAREAVTRFLRGNGLVPQWDEAECKSFLLKVARNETDIEDIAAWLKDHTTPAE